MMRSDKVELAATDSNLSANPAYPDLDYSSRAQEGLDIDGYCRHDDVYLDADTNQHLIRCNQCDLWWQGYGDLESIWSYFLKYGRMDDSSPSTVNISCSRKAWPITHEQVEYVKQTV